MLRFAGVCWHLFGLKYMYWGDLAAVGGLAVFLMQFRRAAFVALESLWHVIYDDVARVDRWPL